jgi:hypothetical protein
MNKQSISFKADEQKLTKTGGIEHYASNIVAYIEATFDLGANWNGYDSVRAVWSNDYLTDISTVLDSNGKCIVPTEVLTDTGNVTVNLVGSIADGDTLTDRLTTYPCKAVIVDADAKVEGEETESITPSQFEQFVEIVHDEVEQVTGMTAEAETLPAGSDATASYSDGVLSFGIPKGDKGEQGEQGETGHTGEPAGFGDVTASVDNTVGTPSVNVTASGPDTAKEFNFEFHNLKGEQGDTGETGETGNGIASTVLNPDYTLTITFTDGTSYTTPSIRGAKGDTGDTGATGNGIQSTVLNADYTLTITFTDGTSYTTPSIRGEQGPAGPVSDVTVNGTSVVDQNGVAVIKIPELVKTVQGNPIVIDDAFGEAKNLDVELTPIQEGSGTPSPSNVRPITGHDSVTVGVTGKNLIHGTEYNSAYYNREIGFDLKANLGRASYTQTDNTITVTTLDSWQGVLFATDVLKAGSYHLHYNSTSTNLRGTIYETDADYIVTRVIKNFSAGTVTDEDITVTDNKRVAVGICGGSAGTVTLTDLQVEYGNAFTSYADYHGQSKTVTLPHTVYGGKPNITTGNGKETMAIVDLSTLTWISSSSATADGSTCYYARISDMQTDVANTGMYSDRFSLASGIYISTMRNGTMIRGNGYIYVATFDNTIQGELVYPLATELDLSTTPTDLTLYSGDNVISSDGEQTLSYVQDMAIVIRKIENQL